MTLKHNQTQNQTRTQKLDAILKRPDVWWAGKPGITGSLPTSQGISSGYSLLDSQLHYGGWPTYALMELLCEHPGLGELSLLAPVLHKLSQNNRWLFLVDPPHEPYAPALEQLGIKLNRLIIVRTRCSNEYVWACEQILRSSTCGVLLAWEHNKRLNLHQVRKLHLAARAESGLAVLLRPPKLARQHSFAALRIILTLDIHHYRLTILKQAGGWTGQTVELSRPAMLVKPTSTMTALPVYVPIYTTIDPSVDMPVDVPVHMSHRSDIPEPSVSESDVIAPSRTVQ